MQNRLENLSLQVLDASPVASILFDEHLAPVYLSSEAQILLGRHRDEKLPAEVLEPLSDLAERAIKKRSSVNAFAKASALTNRLVIPLRGGRSAEILATASIVPVGSSTGCLVSLWDLSAVAPLSAALSLFRSARFVAVQALSEKSVSSNELISILNAAIAAVDALILPTVRVLVESDTSALVKVSPARLFTALSHLVIETSDFAAPTGKVHLRCVLSGQEQRLRGRHKGGSERAIELVLLAQQEEASHAPPSAYEKFLLGLLRTHPYRVTTADEEPTLKQLATGEPTLSKFRLRDTNLPDNASVSPEAYSPHLRAAAEALKDEPAELQVRRLRRDALVVYLGLALS